MTAVTRQAKVRHALERAIRDSQLKMGDIYRMLSSDLALDSAVALARDVGRQLATLPDGQRRILRARTRLAVKDLEALLRTLEEQAAVVREELAGIQLRRRMMTAYGRAGGRDGRPPARPHERAPLRLISK